MAEFENYIEYELDISHANESSVRVLQDATGVGRCGVGSTVWDAGLVLAKYLDKQTQDGTLSLSGKTVLELGSGTGLVGLALAKLQPACTVILSDKSELVPLLERNISLNCAQRNTTAVYLDWCDPESGSDVGAVDMILVSDGVWASELHAPLAETLGRLAGEHTRVILAFESRNFEEEAMFVALWSQKFRFHDIKPQDQHPVMQSEDIFLFEGQRK
ncbi:Protein-lysine N-methyltransferase efm6 [Kickxella alabastrina]|uniref:Protein-lysine N-methyltransferase efm6 n=1 Tax=Kickxella alabastrina TaxID=61397 RepID=A0ACC1I7T1_9FUNG|nr:Protein-lysine N-methyltransferase efm6 [Kickxella alabastrina]